MVGTTGAWKTPFTLMSHSQPMSAFCSVYNLSPHSSQLFRKNSFYVSFLPFFSYFYLFLRVLPPVDTSSQPSLCHCPFQDAPQSKPLDSVDLLVYLIPRFGVLQFPTQFPCFLKYLHPPVAFIRVSYFSSSVDSPKGRVCLGIGLFAKLHSLE